MCVDLHRRVGVQVDLGRGLLRHPQPAARSPRASSPGGCRTACRSRWRRTRPPRRTRRSNSSSVVLVGVRRAPALAEAAERAADDADVRDVDVAVDDERDGVAGQLGAQLVGGLAHVLDRLGAGLGEQRGQLVGVERQRRRAPFAIAPGHQVARGSARSSRRPEPRRGMKLQYLSLDHVEHALLEPARGPCTAGRRRAARSARSRAARAACASGATTGRGARARCGRRWRTGRRGRWRPPRRAAATSRRGSAGSERPRRASAAAHSRTSARMSSSVISRRPAGHAAAGLAVRRRSRCASSAISAGSAP